MNEAKINPTVRAGSVTLAINTFLTSIAPTHPNAKAAKLASSPMAKSFSIRKIVGPTGSNTLEWVKSAFSLTLCPTNHQLVKCFWVG